ncbi:MAG: signal peptide peptidase SppA [Nitrospinae bacterium]|nr:signal peptide peptidase SppA [Nitrospinota bacterium]
MGPSGRNRSAALAVVLFFLVMGGLFFASVKMLSGGKGSSPAKVTAFSRDKVAVVRLGGVIIDSREVNRQLDKWSEDNSVRAIVLKINSPGGVVAPSQEIHSAVRRAMAKKPVVASMGALAASGGYYAAAPCSKIVANPGTITGSIGVIIMFSSTHELMKKIGLGATVVKSGKFKDVGSPHRPFTSEDQELIQGVVDDTYEQFVEDVAAGRKMPVDEVRKLADGRIYTGRQAHKVKLVDQIGDFEDALALAARLGGIEGKPETVEDEKDKGLLRRLMGDGMDEDYDSAISFNRLFPPPGLYFLWPAF